MKKLIATVVGVVSLFLMLIPAAASASPAYTDVSGVISYDGHHVGKGVEVAVVCNGNTLTDKTNKSGTYLVQFTTKQCKMGSEVTVTATYDGVTGNNRGKAKCETNELNIAIINVDVPEFGTAAGIGAVTLSVGAFMIIRRRQLGVR